LFGGFAATGAIARTATNIRNGGNSPIAGVIHAVTLIAILMVLAPLAVNIPLCALAAILFVVSWNMSETKHVIKMIRRAPRADVVILLITFMLTVFADLVVAVNIGVILATLHFMRRMSSSVEVRPATEQELAFHGFQELPEGILAFTIEGPFFFGAVENFERALAGTHTDPKILIIRLKWVPFIDVTGLQTLDDVIKDLHRRGITVMLSGANTNITNKLYKARIISHIGKHNFFENFDQALIAAQNQLQGHYE
jgi:SulP family sulfate permease